MKLTEFFDLVQKVLIKLPAGIKVKNADGTYISKKAGDDFQVDLSESVYSKTETDKQIEDKVATAQTGASITDSDTLKKLQEMSSYLDGTTAEK
ncbi:MAG TPA: hypothetical protein H9820_07990 [Candidatus Companilactobacillus pullicola]|jgi:hypothetical protein|uniref:Uncharacterized protein n=1 Tax=Candidatus Companilactobacillus pullicola TaxID=2838523 RepID=A0A9D1ZP38_9LACO|nr:hypothetical protein [Candidatus Companilactobacillus pullicola]